MKVPVIVRRLAARLGAPGLAGLALTLAGLALGAGVVWPAREELATLRARATNLEARAASAPPPSTASTRADRTAEFRRHFPAAGSSAHALMRLHAIAAQHGLRLPSGDYRYAPEPGTGLGRYQIVLPVKANYLLVRRFVGAALAELPSLAVDAITLKRDSASAREVEGRVQFSLYVATGP
jgi:hypothetical protein